MSYLTALSMKNFAIRSITRKVLDERSHFKTLIQRFWQRIKCQYIVSLFRFCITFFAEKFKLSILSLSSLC